MNEHPWLGGHRFIWSLLPRSLRPFTSVIPRTSLGNPEVVSLVVVRAMIAESPRLKTKTIEISSRDHGPRRIKISFCQADYVPCLVKIIIAARPGCKAARCPRFFPVGLRLKDSRSVFRGLGPPPSEPRPTRKLRQAIDWQQEPSTQKGGRGENSA